MSDAARISRFIGGDSLGKRVDLAIIDNERALIKTALAQSVRHVQTVSVPTAAALAEIVASCETREALALGSCGREGARVVVADKLTPELIRHGAVARTKFNPDSGEGYFRFRDGPGWALIDVDASDPEIAKRLLRMSGAWTVLCRTCPELMNAARVMRLSQSARLHVIGEPRFANLSCHIYVRMRRQSEAPALLERLHQRLWLSGWGHVAVGDAGQLLERSLIDVSVASPERLIFEGAPIIDATWEFGVLPPTAIYLHVDPELDRTLAREGQAIELPPPLTDAEHERYRGMVERAIAAVSDDAKAKAIAHAKARGLNDAEAQRFAKGIRNGEVVLAATDRLTFKGIGTVTVREALLDPDKYVGRDLLDPLVKSHGRDYCARFLRGRTDGTCFVKSFMDGGKIYQLPYDLETAAKALATCREDLRPATYWSCVRKMDVPEEVKEKIREMIA
jgi:hypothetical protein